MTEITDGQGIYLFQGVLNPLGHGRGILYVNFFPLPAVLSFIIEVINPGAHETCRKHNQQKTLGISHLSNLINYRKDGEETLAATRALGIALVAYAPLGRSMLTGTVRGKADLSEGDRRLAHPRFQGENLDKNVSIVSRLNEISKENKCTTAQLVLAWLLAQGKDIVAIPGTKRKARVDENLAALSLKLSAEDLKRISAAAPPGAGAGLRYPAEGMKRVYL